jgi:hypothetical protein
MTRLSIAESRGLSFRLQAAVVLLFFVIPIAGLAMVQNPEPADYATLRYTGETPDNAITRLQSRIDSGRVTLAYDGHWGYLPAVLKALNVPVSSQVLVFSKTSVQKELISPQHPRALYFNDQVYVGYVPEGPVLEFAAVDPKLGAVYYNLLQRQKEKPRFFRNVGQCMECHGGKNADHLPIHLLRSVYPDVDGTPFENAPSYDTTDASPFNERWGGWYVTGRHGSLRHMGNNIAVKRGDAVTIDHEKGANVVDLRARLDISSYLSRYSDIVALMVMEHQLHLQNLITRANYGVGFVLRFERDDKAISGQIAEVCEPLVRALLFADERPLPAPVVGVSGFAAEFARGGPRDSRLRALREPDLKRRLMRYPCSYIIYSEAFDGLPTPAKRYVYRRLWEILTGRDQSRAFAHLSAADRKVIEEILLATRPEYAAQIAGKESR